MSDFTTITANFHILSPIHIGSGLELDPLSYVLKDDYLLLIDFYEWMQNFAEKQELIQKIESEDFASIRRYISEHFDDNTSAVLDRIEIKGGNLKSNYNKE